MQPFISDGQKTAWGKFERISGGSHHLAHHSADVAAVFLDLLQQPPILARAEKALGRPFTEGEAECLAALVFLHDIGKLAPGFQAKSWPDGHGLTLRGHLECGWLWLKLNRPDALAGAVQHLGRWPGMLQWFEALFAHHGRPVPDRNQLGGIAGNVFCLVPSYDWEVEEAVLGRALLNWFPQVSEASIPTPQPRFIHFFCGLLNLADWIGSDPRAFPFEAEFRADYWQTALQQAKKRVQELDLGPAPALRGTGGWALISDHPSPRPAQAAVGALSADAPLVLLEAETGSGKTEAALWRFVTLLAAGNISALYFAVPTRAAARQLQRRIDKALARMFVDPPEALLAVPGQVLMGEVTGKKVLPGFNVLWDDSDARPARWAAEHAARFLAARVAVGTVDQLMLGGLQVKYAHLRASSVARALLVIDEVHASDAYMTEVLHNMVQAHLDLGGHAMLMSATLGSVARRRWLGGPAGDLAIEATRPYPAVWTGPQAVAVDSNAMSGKTVEIAAHSDWSGQMAANLAVEAARAGARVLVIRNTVLRAQETFAACRDAAPEMLLQVNGIPALHHSRFAVEDRALLDEAVEAAIGKDSPMQGRIVIGTQTLEQSLDLCADLLITDLCPMDVLLQRIGRLHRHRRPRPEGFGIARTIVLCPPDGLDPLTRAADNGLGAYVTGPSLSGIYVDVPGLAATLAEIEANPVWKIPAMNRPLVEAATHPEALDLVAEAHGWQDYRQRVAGKRLAETRAADLVLLDRNAPLEAFPDDERIRTRLGEEGAILTLPEGAVGAFGARIRRIALPAHWSRGLTGEEMVTFDPGPPIRVTVSDMVFTYGPEGLIREVSE